MTKLEFEGIALFLALIEQESSGKADALSPAGAIGYCQLMPATAKELGVDPHDPWDNLKGGGRYLIQMLKKFPSIELALAAYNAGPGRVSKVVKEAKTEQWAIVKPLLPKETQSYVGKVIKKAAKFGVS